VIEQQLHGVHICPALDQRTGDFNLPCGYGRMERPDFLNLIELSLPKISQRQSALLPCRCE
jgi:hypothetical protein